MSLTDENGGMVMPVTPMTNATSYYPVNMGGNSGSGMWGGDSWWVILLFILLLGNNGWNNGFGGNNGGVSGLYPWMNQSEQINDGFRDQMLNDNITSIRDGVTGISTQLCNGFNGVQMSLANGFAGVEQGANARQMANMQSMFNIQSALQNCCCENRAGIADLKYTVATENCADRTQAMQNTRDIIDSQTRTGQAILDKLCQLELDGFKRENDNLRTQLNMANLAASQNAQTSRLLADNSAQTAALEQYLNPVPIPAYLVQNPNCCTTNNCNYNCGCGVG